MENSSETVVLATVLMNPAALSQAADMRPSDFSLAAHRAIFTRMRDLDAAGSPIDMIALSAELDRHGELECVGGVVYLSSLIDSAVERPDIGFHVRRVRQIAGARHAAIAAEAIHTHAQQPGVTLSALSRAHRGAGTQYCRV